MKRRIFRALLITWILVLVYPILLAQPSGLTKRVLVAVQNPVGTNGTQNQIAAQFSMQIVSAATDTVKSSGVPGTVSSWSGAVPSTIQNLPAEGLGAVYGEDGTLSLIGYSTEAVTTTIPGLPGTASAIQLTHDQRYVIAANQTAGQLTIIDRNNNNTVTGLNIPGVYGISINPGTSIILAFAQSSNAVYYLRRLSSGNSTAYANHNWPVNAVDCEPLNLPTFCAFEVNAPTGSASTYSAANFDHPVKGLFSSTGSSVYVLNGGAEAGGTKAGVTVLPAAPLLFADGTQSGTFAAALTQIPLNGSLSTDPTGVNMGIVSGSTIYVAGQTKSNGYWGGALWIVNTVNTPASVTSASIADGFATRMLMGDDNTLWIGSMRCNTGSRYQANVVAGGTQPQPYGCLTVVNRSTNTVAFVESWTNTSLDSNCCDRSGDVTGLASIEGSHKVYYTENGQLYIRSTQAAPYAMINNVNVTVAGTAVDVAFIDTTDDTDNTVY